MRAKPSLLSISRCPGLTIFRVFDLPTSRSPDLTGLGPPVFLHPSTFILENHMEIRFESPGRSIQAAKVTDRNSKILIIRNKYLLKRA